MTLTQEEAHRLFEYKDGVLLWKEMVTTRTGNRVGKIAGSIHKHGYRIISVHGRQYKVHRLMFLYHHGYIPEFIDHINGIKADNSVSNLEWVTNQENAIHAIKSGLRDEAHKKARIDNQKQVIHLASGIFYDSLKIACESLNINYGSARNYINRRGKNNFCLCYV